MAFCQASMQYTGVDEESLRRIAMRIAETDDPKKQKGPKMDPKWPKIHTLFQIKIKNTIKDLEQAIRDEDPKLISYLFERTLREMNEMAKALGMRELMAPLKGALDKVFKGPRPIL